MKRHSRFGWIAAMGLLALQSAALAQSRVDASFDTSRSVIIKGHNRGLSLKNSFDSQFHADALLLRVSRISGQRVAVGLRKGSHAA